MSYHLPSERPFAPSSPSPSNKVPTVPVLFLVPSPKMSLGYRSWCLCSPGCPLQEWCGVNPAMTSSNHPRDLHSGSGGTQAAAMRWWSWDSASCFVWLQTSGNGVLLYQKRPLLSGAHPLDLLESPDSTDSTLPSSWLALFSPRPSPRYSTLTLGDWMVGIPLHCEECEGSDCPFSLSSNLYHSRTTVPCVALH